MVLSVSCWQAGGSSRSGLWLVQSRVGDGDYRSCVCRRVSLVLQVSWYLFGGHADGLGAGPAGVLVHELGVGSETVSISVSDIVPMRPLILLSDRVLTWSASAQDMEGIRTEFMGIACGLLVPCLVMRVAITNWEAALNWSLLSIRTGLGLPCSCPMTCVVGSMSARRISPLSRLAIRLFPR